MVEEWEGGYQDADLALALCEEDGERGAEEGVRAWRGVCGVYLGRLGQGEADLAVGLKARVGEGEGGPSRVLMERVREVGRLRRILGEVRERGVVGEEGMGRGRARVGLTRVGGVGLAEMGGEEGEEWARAMAALMVDVAGETMEEGQWREAVEGVDRAVAWWTQWRAARREGEGGGWGTGGQGEGEEEGEEWARRGRVEEGRRRTATAWEERWRLLTTIKKATCQCYLGQLQPGRAGYAEAVRLLEERREGRGESAQERGEREGVMADLARIEAVMVEEGVQ